MTVSTTTSTDKQSTTRSISLAETWSAHNYHPLPVVLSRGEGGSETATTNWRPHARAPQRPSTNKI